MTRIAALLLLSVLVFGGCLINHELYEDQLCELASADCAGDEDSGGPTDDSAETPDDTGGPPADTGEEEEREDVDDTGASELPDDTADTGEGSSSGRDTGLDTGEPDMDTGEPDMDTGEPDMDTGEALIDTGEPVGDTGELPKDVDDTAPPAQTDDTGDTAKGLNNGRDTGV